jgi:hypothetical protein
MIKTHARIPLIAALVAFGASAPDAIAKKGSHKYSAAETTVALSTSDGYPGAGSTALYAGLLDTNAFGNGAVVDHVTITGQPASNVISFKGTEVDYFVAGTARSKFTGTSTVGSDGSQNLAIKGVYNGGSERYRGATGHFSFKGFAAPGSNVVIGRSTGSLVY